jgi:hypothetical protein
VQARYAFLFRCSVPTSFTPSEAAFCRVAVGERFSLRAITVVSVFSRIDGRLPVNAGLIDRLVKFPDQALDRGDFVGSSLGHSSPFRLAGRRRG